MLGTKVRWYSSKYNYWILIFLVLPKLWCNNFFLINKKFKLKKVDKNQIITRSEFWCIYLKLIMMMTLLLCSQLKGVEFYCFQSPFNNTRRRFHCWTLKKSKVIVIPKKKSQKSPLSFGITSSPQLYVSISTLKFNIL